ncbi:MAG: LamG domain-containing protein [Thermoplasmata archaeon]|nr:LamG domain-containing protein [Thermoplasmata archaeon]
MRKVTTLGIVFVLIAVIFAAIPVNVSAEENCPEGMISYWRAEGDALDSVGTNDGVLTNGATFGTGKVGQTFSFDGVDDYVSIGDMQFPTGSATRTIEAFIKTSASIGEYYIFAYGWGASQSFGFGVYHSKLMITQWGQHIASSTTVTDNAWHHVAIIFDGTTYHLYIDGAEDGTRAMPTDTVLTGQAYIGRGLVGNYFVGNIDEVAVWNKALTPEEINNHYLNGLDGKGYCMESIEATIDLDPDTLNLKSKGKWLTAYIELPEGYDVNDIDQTTISLAYTLFEVGGEYGEFDTSCSLMMKFDRQAVIDILSPGEVELTITDQLYDGQTFSGTDTITVISPGK